MYIFTYDVSIVFLTAKNKSQYNHLGKSQGLITVKAKNIVKPQIYVI